MVTESVTFLEKKRWQVLICPLKGGQPPAVGALYGIFLGSVIVVDRQ